MDKETRSSGETQKQSYIDLTEEASKRPEGEAATIAARQAESDDIKEENGRGQVDKPEGTLGDNKVSTLTDR